MEDNTLKIKRRGEDGYKLISLRIKEETLKTCGVLYIIGQLVEGASSLIEDSQADDIAKKCNCKFEKIKDYNEIDSIFNKAVRETLSK